MLLRDDTRNIQSALATYCRTGEQTFIEGAKAERLHHYRRLVYNVLNDTLETAYPITRQILSHETWEGMLNDFFRKHNPASPQVWKMPEEFCTFCLDEGYARTLDRPFLNDLLLFEWMEIEVHTMEDQTIPPFSEDGDLLDSPLVINPEYRLLHLHYPVHKRPASELSQHQGDYFVLVYRHQDNLAVRFFEMSPLFALVFELLAQHSMTARETLKSAAGLFNIKDEQELMQNALPFLNDLFIQGIILGYRVT